MAVDLKAREATLRERVRKVYAAFRGYRLAPHIEPDPCFPSVCDDGPLRAERLHLLPAAAFDRYQLKAMTTWGSVEDFKHFLPRLLEIIANAESNETLPQVEAWMVFGKLSYGQWRRWQRAEQQALDAYFDALWSALLARSVEMGKAAWQTPTLGEWLCAFAHAHDDLTRFLNQWEAEADHPTEGLTAAAHLARTIIHARDDLLKKGSLNWDMYDQLAAQEGQTVAWLASDVVARLLEAAFFRWSESLYAPLISEGHYWLGWWRQRRAAGA
jgi:hypothetical protein